jgi:hypothetical protein
LRLIEKRTIIQNPESTIPASKKGSGMMMGPVPSNKLIVRNAALYFGVWIAYFIRWRKLINIIIGK